MGVTTYRSTDGGQQFDAFYRDEWGPVNTAANCSMDQAARSGFHKNRFTLVSAHGGTVTEAEGGWTLPARNRANPHTNPGLANTSNPVPASASDDFTVTLIPSAEVLTQMRTRAAGGLWTGELSVSLFFAVGQELNRHGLRSFVERAAGLHVVIHVRCNEAVKPFFARVIDTAQIESLLAHALLGRVPWKLRVIAGYSFGSAGVNQAILNELVDLTTVRRLVFYDCLYTSQYGSTAEAIKLLRRKAGPDLRIVIYKTSEHGNSVVDGGRLKVVADNPGLIDRRGIVENLYQSRDFQALCVFRSLQGAVDDGVVSLPTDLKARHDKMVIATAALPRGSVISSGDTWAFVRGTVPAGTAAFGDWAKIKTNAAALRAYGEKLGRASKRDTFRGILWPNFLPGWWNRDDAEDVHDLVIPEIGWEYLTY
ncbi:hypothetical protein [Nocardia abscessus]|uniref:hypothetical protein n=1 Tax=Nocardia abscessus TaxID=120957 RepID=UPI002454F46B|nr:hypothetical protein [Nocardia abscessus]